jgi:hypothetical protein
MLNKANFPAHRVIAKNRFTTLDTIEAVIQNSSGSNGHNGAALSLSDAHALKR